MHKILLLDQEGFGKTRILKEFFQNLSPLLNIKGFCTDKNKASDEVQINLLSQRSVSFSLNLKKKPEEIKKAVDPYIESLIYELSIFELIDIFLLDKLGLFEIHIPRLQQQIITIFSSRIPVIATAHQQDVPKLDYILNHFPIKTLNLNEFSESDLFPNLIKELYDL